jgi:ribosomal protein S18 acetylase RimI-like enzyme
MPDIAYARLRQAQPSDRAAILKMRNARAQQLLDMGIRQWLPGEFGERLLQEWIDQRWVHVAVSDSNDPVGCVAVLWADPDIWGDRGVDGSAGYIHLLVTAPAAAGQSLGDHLLRHAEMIIAQRDRSWSRLDAVSSNPFLLDWYEARGYESIGERHFEKDEWFDCTLMEKDLTPELE